MGYRYIDMDTYNRKQHFSYFNRLAYPFSSHFVIVFPKRQTPFQSSDKGSWTVGLSNMTAVKRPILWRWKMELIAIVP